METKIKWNEGEGYITATYEGSGSGSASISSDVNEGLDREQSIKVETTDKSVSATLVVSQEGLREKFIPSDGDFILADGGTFNVLKDVNPYTEIEYIETTGTQYIDTGMTGDLDTSYEIEASTSVTTDGFMVLFGSRLSASSRVISTLVNPKTNIVNDFGDYTSTRQSYPITSNVRYRTFNSKSERSVYDYESGDIDTVTTKYTSEFETPTNLYIGYKSSGFTESMTNFQGRIYSCKIWQNDVLMRDYIPVLDNEGVACLYERVSGEFYYNQGTGDFIAGSKI